MCLGLIQTRADLGQKGGLFPTIVAEYSEWWSKSVPADR